MRAEDLTDPETAIAGDLDGRIADLLETIQGYATLDFSRRARIGPEGNDLDALAAGINMLGEEIEAAQRHLSRAVEERTHELTRRMRELERLNREVVHLTAMTNLLQVCATRDEAFNVLGDVFPKLFADTVGAVYLFAPSRDVIESIASWGGDRATQALDPATCWGLRRGRPHRSGDRGGLRCAHLPSGSPPETLCVPLTAQGQTIGLVHLRWDMDATPGADLERLAEAASEQIALALANVELKAALQSQSIRDSLSGLYNRRFLDETLARELRRADRDKTPVSFLMIDIDHFKTFNDRHGHGAGDGALRQVATRLLDAVRAEDVVCRYGGEEFAIVMAGTGTGAAEARAHAMRASVAASVLDWHGQPIGKVTVSVGVASYPDHAQSHDGLVRAADQALYEAKRGGRDQVVVATATSRQQ